MSRREQRRRIVLRRERRQLRDVGVLLSKHFGAHRLRVRRRVVHLLVGLKGCHEHNVTDVHGLEVGVDRVACEERVVDHCRLVREDD